ncbi:MAG: M4 family metallopeptidase, partial [Anaerolineales bacterium]
MKLHFLKTAWLSLLTALTVCSLLLSMVGVRPVSAIQPGKENAVDDDFALLATKCLNSEGLNKQKNPHTDKLHFVGAESDKPIKHPDTNSTDNSPEQAARGYLKECGELFGVQDEARELKVKRVKELDHGNSVARFQQSVNDIPVLGGEIIVQMDAHNDILTIVSELTDAPLDNPSPSIGVDAAIQAALEMVAKKNGLDISILSTSTPELWFYDPFIFDTENGTAPALVWRLEVRAVDKPINELVLIDAQTKAVLLRFNQIDDMWASPGEDHPIQTGNMMTNTVALTLGSPLISVYTLDHSMDDSAFPGTLVCAQNDPSLCNVDADAQAAFQYTLDTYNFYANLHGRDSIDNAGMELITSVHYGTGYQNAYWNGSQMTYGDGWTADDVVAHEISHGVTQNESGLIYYGQSGAINESFSDLWGEFVDQTNTGGSDGTGYNWQVGEDIPVYGAIRNMQDPTIFGNPDTTDSFFYYHGSSDNAGVHTNSGVNNKAVYLMVAGGDFNGYSITGIGLEKTVKIYYEAQTNLLTSGATYVDLFNALNQACSNLEGQGVVTIDDCSQVNHAALAVKMDVAPIPPPPPDNDNFANAIAISSMPYADEQNTISATTEVSDPILPCGTEDQGTNSVWYRYTPTADGLLTVNTFGSEYDTILAVWIGSVDNLTNVICQDDSNDSLQSQIKILVTAGETYYIEAAGYWESGYLYIDADFSIPNSFTSCSEVVGIPETECNALVSIYTNTGGPNWTTNMAWLAINTPCDWYGVTCMAGRVTQIHLSNNNLVGTLSSIAWIDLPYLETLTLGQNQLSGSIPAQLSNLGGLTYLGLWNNQLTGTLPLQLGSLLNLRYLFLDGNQLSGGIPSELGSLSNLHFLSLSDNQLTGQFPPELTNLASLFYLELNGNHLSGNLPTTIGNLSSLEGLY